MDTIQKAQDYKRLGKRTYYYLFSKKASFAIFLLLLFIVLAFVRLSQGSDSSAAVATGWATLVVLVLFLICFVYAILSCILTYVALRYKIDQNGFSIQRGILSKEESSIPFRQIQDIDIEQGIMLRMWGLCNLVILTAGHSDTGDKLYASNDQSEVVLPAMPAADARDIKNYLLSRSNIQEVAAMPGQMPQQPQMQQPQAQYQPPQQPTQ